MCTHARNVELLNTRKGCICWIATSNIYTIDNYALSEADVVQDIPFHAAEPNVMDLTSQMLRPHLQGIN